MDSPKQDDMTDTNLKRRSAMNVNPGFSTAFRVLRGNSGQWEVVEEGKSCAVASFEAPQAALSYACSIAEAKHGSLVIVFDQPHQPKSRHRAARYHRHLSTSSAVFAGRET
jgi:hypothetical protein